MSSKVRALYGGSFDPPHFGHQMAILYLLEGGYADEVRVIPCFQHAFGKSLSPFALRVSYCEAMVRPFGKKAVVDPIEATLDCPSFSYQTAEALAARFPGDELRWVIGSDAAQEVDRWAEPDRLRQTAPLLVLARQGANTPVVQPPLVLPEVASRDLRARLSRGEDLQGWVPKSVLEQLNR